MHLRRWYDQEPVCHHLMNQIQLVPQPEAQQFCGRLLGQLAEQMRKRIQETNQSQATSIGFRAIEGLYGFNQHHRRWYDHVQPVHRAVSRLYMLPSEGLVALGFSSGDLFGLLSVYAQVCDELKQKPSAEEMATITRKVLFEGQDQGAAFLKLLIGDEVFEVLFQPASQA